MRGLHGDTERVHGADCAGLQSGPVPAVLVRAAVPRAGGYSDGFAVQLPDHGVICPLPVNTVLRICRLSASPGPLPSAETVTSTSTTAVTVPCGAASTRQDGPGPHACPASTRASQRATCCPVGRAKGG